MRQNGPILSYDIQVGGAQIDLSRRCSKSAKIDDVRSGSVSVSAPCSPRDYIRTYRLLTPAFPPPLPACPPARSPACVPSRLPVFPSACLSAPHANNRSDVRLELHPGRPGSTPAARGQASREGRGSCRRSRRLYPFRRTETIGQQ